MEIGKLNNVTIAMSNNDEGLTYAINAQVQIQNNQITNVNNGVVMKGDEQVATFNRYGNSSVNYNIEKEDETLSIVQAILEYMAGCGAIVEAGFTVEVGGK